MPHSTGNVETPHLLACGSREHTMYQVGKEITHVRVAGAKVKNNGQHGCERIELPINGAKRLKIFESVIFFK